MSIIELGFGAFFGSLLRLSYALLGNFGLALLAFTVLTKIILFPISLISQKNSIIMVKMQPLLADLQARYGGQLETLVAEQKALYKQENYSTLKSLLPLLVQIPLIIGVIRVVNNPLRYLGSGVDPYFLGIDLFALPTGLLIPLLAIGSTVLLCLAQNRYNVISREQGFLAKWGTTLFLVAFTGWFVFICPAGLGLYWTFSNLLGIVTLVICNAIYNPHNFIDYAHRPRKTRVTRAEKDAARAKKQREKAREKADLKRFYAADKELVFYSEASGFYKYFAHFIDYVLQNSDIVVHYLTSDVDDQVFALERDNFVPYFCSSHSMITAFMKLDADLVVMTMPDLETYHYKRSLVNKDIEYIYTDHGEGSYHMMLRKGALDHFDTIFCYSTNHNEEVRATERVYGLPEKKLVNVGFGLLDQLIAEYEAACGETEAGEDNSDTTTSPLCVPDTHTDSGDVTGRRVPQILVAPSWQRDNLLEYCLEPLMEGLLSLDAHVIIRPHPEFVKRFPGKMKHISDTYADVPADRLEIQTDFSSNATVYLSDLVITDWSSIAQEFSFTTKKPSLFINTPVKVMNPEWEKLGIEPMELWMREMIGVSVEVDDLARIPEVVTDLLGRSDEYRTVIEELLERYMYNRGHTAEVGGRYLIDRIEERRRRRDEDPARG